MDINLINLFQLFFVGIFIYINLKIVYIDYKYKKIKNFYLFFLLLLVPIYRLLFGFSLDNYFYIYFIILFLLLIVLYFFEFIPAGDVKYIIVLSFFVGGKDIPLFFGLVSILLLLKIIFNYLYFLYVKRKEFLQSVWQKKISKIKILKLLLIFLNTFLFINILNYFLFDYLKNYLDNFGQYKILYFIFIMLLIFLVKYSYNFVLKRFVNKETFYFLFLKHIGIILFFVGIFINYFLFEDQLIKLLLNNFYIIKIFLLFLFLNFLIKSFGLFLQQNNEKFIFISDLKEGDMVDKEFLHYIFGRHKSIKDYLLKKGIIEGEDFFDNFENPIDKEKKNKIIQIYENINERNRLEDNGYSEFYKIKVFNIFSFGPYIFLGLLLLFIYKIYLFF